MNGCPSGEQLEQFLYESLSPADSRAISDHVGGCARCQVALDERTSGAAVTTRTSVAASPTSADAEPVLSELLDRMRQAPPEPDRPAPAFKRSTEKIVFPLPPSPDAPLGQLDSYQILEKLGSGSGGMLFKAHDAKLDRTVAIKVLRHELAGLEIARARFEREARAAASLKHDHIVTVFDVVFGGDFPPYLVLEFIAGESLADRLRHEGSLEPRAAARIVQQVALGLSEAHERGLVHRDIKPSNIMLDLLPTSSRRSTTAGDIRAKITDFGLARSADAGTGLTMEGTLAGTPAYMSPEQLTNPKTVDGRTDVYSLGIVLYELLAGEPPFRGAMHMILRQVLNAAPRPPRQWNDKIPADLETICLKAVAKDSTRRYATAAELAADLGCWLAGEPIHARSIGPAERFWQWSRRNRPVAALSAAVVLLLITLAAVASIAITNVIRARRDSELAANAGLRARGDAREAREEYDASIRRASDKSPADLLVATAEAALALASDVKTPKDRADTFRSRAVEQLRAAIRLDPSHSRSSLWRFQLARQLKTQIAAMSDDGNDALREEARELVRAALAAPPAEVKLDLLKLQQELDAL